MYCNGIKRVLDFILALAALCITLVPMLIIALVIVCDDPGNPIFAQKRVAKGKKHFTMYKFRTMRMDTPHDVPTHQLEESGSHITRVGKILRKTSLDELPQLWNILKGDMAIVGPRPALYNQYDLLAERDQYGANDIRPGLTGWAQITGRDELTVVQKAERDGEYVKRMSFAFDVRCIVGTVFSVATGDGIVEGKQAAEQKETESAGKR